MRTISTSNKSRLVVAKKHRLFPLFIWMESLENARPDAGRPYRENSALATSEVQKANPEHKSSVTQLRIISLVETS
jgi:hypothetical protein